VAREWFAVGLDPHWQLIRLAQKAFTFGTGEFVPAIYDVVKAEAWKSYTRPMSPGTTTPATFGEFIRDVFACEPEIIEAVLRKSNQKELANRVLGLIHASMTPIRDEPGRPLTEDSAGVNVGITNINPSAANDTIYAVRRLKRDRPDLAERVIAGELSPNAAAIEAGFRHSMISVRSDDAAAAIRVLLRRYSREDLLAALAVSIEGNTS
jgi:hypothetical protein